MSDFIDKTLIQELTTPVPHEIAQFAEAIAYKMGEPPLGILFYGSLLREVDPTGILDFYVITEKPASLSGNPFARFANRVLPPNVYYMEHQTEAATLRAKVAVLSQEQFLRRGTLFSLDTTIWARFCQPVRLVWVRNGRAADRILQALRQCLITASCWAALLGPKEGEAIDYWRTLFAHTYAAELRVEKKGRGHKLLKGREERYEALLKASWQQAGLSYQTNNETLRPYLTASSRKKAAKNWQKIAAYGRPLNLSRLIKAAFTFKDGVSYLLWKIQRHTGKQVHVFTFERKHPILTLPFFLWRARHFRKTTK
ncbi:hypothetical protein [Bombella sp. ESL0385]|uniref:hypothetical protein n=1 Tax=Bombella sp. ESL0385 TaxID=2676446 RepID=UPI0012D9BA42|nr:hypothetical protein [Bombella sp. ESL0385]MUG90239.1 hypothetical protein [Bombella sp. ESL0385]